MPVFNRDTLLNNSAMSILGQDYKNLELIILDDASTTPSTQKVIEYLTRTDSRVRAFRSERKLGGPMARNFCI